MSEEAQLKALRNRIDAIDEKVLELISERARCAQVVAEVKQKTLAEGEQPVFYRPEREAQVLKRIMELNKGPLDNEEVARLFREIMSACLALEEPLRVAYLGPRSEEHTSELQSRPHLVCRLLLEKKKKKNKNTDT